MASEIPRRPATSAKQEVPQEAPSLAVALKFGVGTALLAALVVDSLPPNPPMGVPRVRISVRNSAVRKGRDLDLNGLLRLVGQVLWNDIVTH